MMRKPILLIALGCTGLLLLNYVDQKQASVLEKLPMAVLITGSTANNYLDNSLLLMNKHDLLTLIQGFDRHLLTDKTVDQPDMTKNK